MRSFQTCLVFLILSLVCSAQSAKPSEPAKSAPKALSELAQLRVLAAYQHALLKAADAQKAQDDFQRAKDAFFTACAAEVRSAGLAEGTTCNVQPDTNVVTVTEPPAKDAKETKK